MSRILSRTCVAVAVMGLALTAPSARADWVLSVVDSAGLSSQTVNVGDMFQLRIVVSGSVTDEIDVFSMDLAPSGDADVTFDSYVLNPRSFLTGGPPQNDFSNLAQLHFEAGTDFPTVFKIRPEDAGLATLITLDLTATSLGTLSISTVPVFFEGGFGFYIIVPTTAGEPFSLTVVPEPATLALLGLGGVLAMRRRRKT